MRKLRQTPFQNIEEAPEEPGNQQHSSVKRADEEDEIVRRTKSLRKTVRQEPGGQPAMKETTLELNILVDQYHGGET